MDFDPMKNGLKKIIIGNIVALLMAAGALIWNLSAFNSDVRQMREALGAAQEVQTKLLEEQIQHHTRINRVEGVQIQIIEDVSRLKDIHLDGSGPDRGG